MNLTFSRYKKQYILNSIAAAIILIPVLIYYYSVLTWTVNIPKWDDYGAILKFSATYFDADFLEKIRLVFSFHNEHRIFFVRVSSLLCYYLTGELNFQYLAIWGNLGLLGLSFIIYKSIDDKANRLWVFIPVPFLLFQLQYLELSLWSMASIQIIFSLFFSFTSLYFLNRDGNKFFIGAIVFALLSTFNSGNGMVTFLAGVYIITSKQNSRAMLWKWLGVAALVLLLYFGFGSRGGLITQISQDLVQNPYLVLGHFFSFLGSSSVYIFGVNWTWFVSAMSFLLYIYIIFFRKGNQTESKIFIAFSIFVIGTALVVALRRGPELGFEQALSSRYKIHSLLYLITLYLFFWDYCKINYKKYYCAIMSVVCILFFFAFLERGYRVMKVHKNFLVTGLIRYHLDFKSNTLNAKNPDEASKLVEDCQKKGYCKFPNFNELAYRSNWVNIPLSKETNNIKSTFSIKQNEDLIYIYDGWAFIQDTSAVGNQIFVVLKGQDTTFVWDTFPHKRREVTAHFKKQNLDDSGFSFSVSKDQLDLGPYKMAILITKGNLQAFQFKKFIKINERKQLDELNTNDLIKLGLQKNYYYLDKVQVESENINIRGWAFRTGRSSKGSRVKIRLYSDQDQFIFNTTPQKRTEVTRAYSLHNANYHDSGFKLKASSSLLSKGHYRIDLIIDNPEFKDTIRIKNKTLKIE